MEQNMLGSAPAVMRGIPFTILDLPLFLNNRKFNDYQTKPITNRVFEACYEEEGEDGEQQQHRCVC